VTASGTPPTGSPVTANAGAPVITGAPSTLAVAKSTDKASVHAGQGLTYTIPVTNTGTVSQSNLAVADPFPAGLAAAGTVTVTFPTVNATDNFDCGISYSCNSNAWMGDWVDSQGDGPNSGDIRVVSNPGGGIGSNSAPDVLSFSNTGRNILRPVYLGGTSNATLSFVYKRAANFNNTNAVTGMKFNVELTGDVTAATPVWTSVGQISATGANAADATWQTFTTIVTNTALLTGKAGLRLSTTGGGGGFFLDDLAIAAPGDTNRPCSACAIATAPATSTLTPSSDRAATWWLQAGSTVTWTVVTNASAASDGFTFNNTVQATTAQQVTPVAGAASTPFDSPAIAIAKTASVAVVQQPLTPTPPPPPSPAAVTYTYTVTNPGNQPIEHPTNPNVDYVPITDNRCAPVTYQSGDTNGDRELQRTETWIYTCTGPVTSNDANPVVPDTVTNTATINGRSQSGDLVSAQATASVTVVHPGLAVTVTPPAVTTYANRTVTYTYTVTNVGDIPLDNVAVTDSTCPSPIYVSGDTNDNGKLDLTEQWTYTCTTTPIAADQTSTVGAAATDDATHLPVASDNVHATVNVINPALSITKVASDSLTGQSGTAITVGPTNNITYTYQVTNTGDDPITISKATGAGVGDSSCIATTYQSGDANNDGRLDLTETWTFSCTPSPRS
jgi:uncharacterized repeat protein (TIGR01451 family)